jgi:hypothetical protein
MLGYLRYTSAQLNICQVPFRHLKHASAEIRLARPQQVLIPTVQEMGQFWNFHIRRVFLQVALCTTSLTVIQTAPDVNWHSLSPDTHKRGKAQGYQHNNQTLTQGILYELRKERHSGFCILVVIILVIRMVLQPHEPRLSIGLGIGSSGLY